MKGMNSEAGEPPAGVYRRYLESGRLGFQRCSGCGEAVFYPRVACPVCGGVDLVWKTKLGAWGHLRDYGRLPSGRRPIQRRPRRPGGGFRMMSRVEGVPAERVEIGMRVAFWVDREGDDPILVFVPEDR